MDTTKITLKVDEKLLLVFSQQMEKCYLKRDAFLNHMIRTEVPHLEKELADRHMSNTAKRYISQQLNRRDLVTINVVVEKSTAEALRVAVGKHNLVRDAFINRLILFLICPPELLRLLGIPNSIKDESFIDVQSPPVGPLPAIYESISDPLFYIRESLENAEEETIYATLLLGNMIGFNCFFDDALVPGTDEEVKASQETQLLLASLFADYKESHGD